MCKLVSPLGWAWGGVGWGWGYTMGRGGGLGWGKDYKRGKGGVDAVESCLPVSE